MTRQMCRGMQFPPYDFHPGVLYRWYVGQPLRSTRYWANQHPYIPEHLAPRHSLDAASPYPTCLPASSLLYASLIQPRRFNGLPHIDPSTATTVRSPPGALTVCLVSGDVRCDSTIVLCLSSIVLCHRHPAFAPHRPIVAPHRPANTDLFMHYDSVLGR
ncbi:hypothetical protein B0H10DRAFT_2208695 [Mycena sp. CBHHK59/15]|nr:hypothetical protein B0H10DRAFT_2208695 [Mycena sp. CBHHK59/15]